jgi:hypothetical protein
VSRRFSSFQIRYGAQVLSRENLELVLDEMPDATGGELATI